MNQTLILIGFKSSGKTSVGHYFAREFNYHLIDTDVLLEEQYCKVTGTALSRAAIYRSEGESYFRALEKTVIMTLHPLSRTVIATGGGSVLDPHNVRHLKQQGRVVYLYASRETLLARMQGQPIPAFLDPKQFTTGFNSLYEQRQMIYKESADVEINTDNHSVAAIADILGSL